MAKLTASKLERRAKLCIMQKCYTISGSSGAVSCVEENNSLRHGLWSFADVLHVH